MIAKIIEKKMGIKDYIQQGKNQIGNKNKMKKV